MAGVENPPPAAGLVLGVGGTAGLFYHGFVVGKQQHVAPFPQQRGDLFAGFHGPAVIVANGVGLLKLGDGSMGQNHHVVPGVQHFFQGIQQLAELFFRVSIALAVPEILNALDLGAGADGVNAEPFGPVGGVDHQGAAGHIAAADLGNFIQQHGPAGGRGQAGNVQPLGAALGVNEYRGGELGGKSAFADALRPVQNGFDRRGNGAGCDCVFAHFRTLLSSRLWGRVVPRRLLPCHPQ